MKTIIIPNSRLASVIARRPKADAAICRQTKIASPPSLKLRRIAMTKTGLCIFYTLLALFLMVLLFPTPSFARQLNQENLSKNNPVIEIADPETSQRFLSELSGGPQTFTINWDKNFELYVRLLVPKTEDTKKNISAEIYGPNNQLYGVLDGENFKWEEFYDASEGNSYYAGPSFTKGVIAGTYKIVVYSLENKGKYALDIGTQEETLDQLKNVGEIFSTKKSFFDRSFFSAFLSYSGLMLVGLAIAALALLYFLYRRFVKRDH